METLVKIPKPDGSYVPATANYVVPRPDRVCILAHGIFVTRSENGRFDRLAQKLAGIGISSIRFDFGGHGESPTPSISTSPASFADDLAAVHAYLNATGVRQIDLVASSFAGAVISLLNAGPYPIKLNKLVMLNPVLDFVSGFVSPALPEMKKLFSKTNLKGAFNTGKFCPVPHFEMSRVFLLEMMSIDLPERYKLIREDHLILHGTRDELIPYRRTMAIASTNSNSTWVPIKGAFHAFNRPEHELAAHSCLLAWLGG